MRWGEQKELLEKETEKPTLSGHMEAPSKKK